MSFFLLFGEKSLILTFFSILGKNTEYKKSVIIDVVQEVHFMAAKPEKSER